MSIFNINTRHFDVQFCEMGTFYSKNHKKRPNLWLERFKNDLFIVKKRFSALSVFILNNLRFLTSIALIVPLHTPNQPIFQSSHPSLQ